MKYISLKYLGYLILIIGIALRICIYLQNRNLFLDEANVARNIYERNFIGLLYPLNYYQYAPPIFLWALKLLTNLFGYSEYIFKIIPLLSGIGSLILFYFMLKRFHVERMFWYTLFLMATGYIYIRYTTELKQYSTDSFISLALVHLALSVTLSHRKLWKFLMIWIVLGSFAIWSSMPSAFVLAGVGLYYLINLYITKEEKMAYVILGCIVSIWLLQFACYYILVLKPQITSSYLQTTHGDNFLYLFPGDLTELKHNWDKTSNILGVAAGHWVLSVVLHIILIGIAISYSIKKRLLPIILILVPIFFVLLAASLHQFSLEPRVILFIMPFILVLIGIGFEQLIVYKYLRAIFLLVSMICLYNFNELKYFYKPMKLVQITESMDFLLTEKIESHELYIHYIAFPAYFYYTEINPRKQQWAGIKKGHQLSNTMNYDSLSQTMHGQTAILYGYIDKKEVDAQQSLITKHIRTVKRYKTVLSEAYIYTAP